MINTRDFERRVGTIAAPVLLLCVCGWLAGCQGEKTVGTKTGDAEKKPSAATVMARTWRIRQAYVDAKSEKQLKAARKAMIADLKKRYAGIDCHAPQDKIGPHKFLFRQLLQEWNPIGCTIEDLKAIAGKPRKETRDSVTLYLASDCLSQRFTVERKRCCSGLQAGTTTRGRQTVRTLVSETVT